MLGGKATISGWPLSFSLGRSRDLLKGSGVEIVRLPPRSPNLNAYAERFVRSIKDQCLSRMILFGERSLRKATREFAAHYHRERNHQGIDTQRNRVRPTTRRDSFRRVLVLFATS